MIVGVDLSSFRIDLAWSDEEGIPGRWHTVLGKPSHKLVPRLRSAKIEWPAGTTTVVIEKPMSHHRTSLFPLAAVCGIIANQAPPTADVYFVRSQRLRAALGLKDVKEAAQAYLADIYPGWDYWDEHEQDALVAALGGCAILESSHPDKEKYLNGS